MGFAKLKRLYRLFLPGSRLLSSESWSIHLRQVYSAGEPTTLSTQLVRKPEKFVPVPRWTVFPLTRTGLRTNSDGQHCRTTFAHQGLTGIGDRLEQKCPFLHHSGATRNLHGVAAGQGVRLFRTPVSGPTGLLGDSLQCR